MTCRRANAARTCAGRSSKEELRDLPAALPKRLGPLGLRRPRPRGLHGVHEGLLGEEGAPRIRQHLRLGPVWRGRSSDGGGLGR